MIVGESKPPLAELAHYGVKGMKWGVIRDKLSSVMAVKDGTPQAARIQRESDAHARVNSARTVAGHKKALDDLAEVQRQNKLETRQEKAAKKTVVVKPEKAPKPQRTEEELQRRRARQQLAVVGGIIALNIIAKHGLASLGDIGAAGSSATALGSSAAKINYVKPSFRGVHKITTMK